MARRTSFLDDRLAEIRETGPTVPLDYDELKRAARSELADGPHGYVMAAAGSESTLTENRRALDEIRIVPRVLRDVSSLSLETEVLERTCAGPVVLAPIGVQQMYHEAGETASARAAADLSIPFALSTAASRSIEVVAEELGSTPSLFQLYWHPDREVTGSYVERAEAAGFDAIVLTVDAPVPRWIPENLQRGYRPGGDIPKAIPASDPAFERYAIDHDASVEEMIGEESILTDRSITWDDLEFLRDRINIPIVLKGIMHPSDAATAADLADGVVVSNHGGRQSAGQLGAAQALPEVVEAVGGEVPVFFDSGVRSGVDVFKALALGADAVFLGRPYVLGLTVAGASGVRAVTGNVLAELESVMGMSGYANVEEIGEEALRRSD